jgi:hypothetical protein
MNSLFEDEFVVMMNVGAVVFVIVGNSLEIYVFSEQRVGKPLSWYPDSTFRGHTNREERLTAQKHGQIYALRSPWS